MPEQSPVFGRTRRLLHWTIAAFLCVQVPLAWIMVDQKLSPAKLENYALHKSLGLCLLTLAVARLVWALLSNRPALPAATPRYERILARIAEGLLYLIVILMPVTGWLMSSAANTPVSFFGLFTLPDLVAPSEDFLEAMRLSHRMQSYVLLSLVSLHFLAALRHHLLLRDGVLYSMLPLRWFRRD